MFCQGADFVHQPAMGEEIEVERKEGPKVTKRATF
jgi:hypothetical protein